MEVVTLAPESDRWTGVLAEVRHDAYHLPSYAAFAARRQEPGDPRLYLVEEDGARMLVPLIVRAIPADIAGDGLPSYDATSSRGYPGPIVAMMGQRFESAFADRALEALAEHLRRERVVSVFARMHPLFPVPEDAFGRHGPIVDHGDSVFVDLGLSEEELRAQTRHGHRQDINRATRLGYVARMDERWERFDAFVDLFAESMDRVGATPYWRLTRDYFVDLRDSLADRIHLCVVEIDGMVASAGLLTEVDGIVEYHLAGTANEHVRASPSKLVVDFARWWAKGRGNRVLHLTGSLRRGDSLSNFKTGFSPLTRPVCSWRFVSDEPEYRRLNERWTARNGTVADAADGFFPAYRKPPPEAI